MRTQIYDVLPGRPFGRGTTSPTISSDPHTRRTGSGTSGTNTLTINSAAYSNGDLILIHQTKGLSAVDEDNWELALITSGGGTTTLTLQDNLGRTYTTAQVLDVKEYLNPTIGTFTVTGWGGSTGGLLAIAARGTMTISGTPECNGLSAGTSFTDQGAAPGTGGGFRGGGNSVDNSSAQAGEGYTGTYTTETQSAVGNGGGGGGGSGASNSGGGGGNVTSGTTGTGGNAGVAVGTATLSCLLPGGGGGGGKAPDNTRAAGGGGNGGGMVVIWANLFTVSGGIQLKGGTGGDSTQADGAADGGSGAGGSLLINTYVATLGTSLIQATGGAGSGIGGAGADGRVRVNYGGPVPTGTTSPTNTPVFNNLLAEQRGGAFLFM